MLVVLHLQKVGRVLVGGHLPFAVGLVLPLDLFLVSVRELQPVPPTRLLFVPPPPLLRHLPKLGVLPPALLGQTALPHFCVAPVPDCVALLSVALLAQPRGEPLLGLRGTRFEVAQQHPLLGVPLFLRPSPLTLFTVGHLPRRRAPRLAGLTACVCDASPPTEGERVRRDYLPVRPPQRWPRDGPPL